MGRRGYPGSRTYGIGGKDPSCEMPGWGTEWGRLVWWNARGVPFGRNTGTGKETLSPEGVRKLEAKEG